MLTKTMMGIGAAIVLFTAFGTASHAQSTQDEWWAAYRNRQVRACVSGPQDVISANPSWLLCNDPRRGS